MVSRILNIVIVVLISGLVIQYIYKIPKFTKGNKAPDFSTIDIEGQQFNLYNRPLSDYTLINFWGSWCAPCRRKNKEIAKLSKDYSAEQLMIVGLAIERNDKTFRNAIEVDSIQSIIHLPQLNYFSSEIAKLYGVREIPTSYLVNQKNQIVAVNPTIKNIHSILADKKTN
ncbi:MAG TPA: TlpA disulfide reductase family protein [Saprospiraceae bacterium]|nr:TlpA disulfide reductase family protein [Saprospiraceae bacterium]